MKKLKSTLLFIPIILFMFNAYALIVAVPERQIYETPSPANESFYFCTYNPYYHCYYQDVNINEYNYPYYPISNPYYNRYDYPHVIRYYSEYPQEVIEEQPIAITRNVPIVEQPVTITRGAPPVAQEPVKVNVNVNDQPNVNVTEPTHIEK